MSRDPLNRRGAVDIVTVILGLGMLVAIIAMAPILYHFIGMASAEAGPFTSLALQLTLPTLIIGLILSVGVSARRR